MPFALLSRSRFSPHALFLLRVVVGLLFLQHGLAKLIDFPHMSNIPETFAVFGYMGADFKLAAGFIETISGVLLAAGLLARPMAFLLEPIRKEVESEESVVIQGATGGRRACGHRIIVEPPIAAGCGTRAT